MEYELSCQYDARQSFYGKAMVKTFTNNNNVIFRKELYSYGTLVATIIIDDFKGKIEKIKYRYFGKYSQTTTRHQKEFFRQNGLSDREIKELFKNMELVKEV